MTKLTLLLFFTLSLSTLSAQDKIINKIKALEAQLSPVLEKNDVPALSKILHPNFTVQSMGMLTHGKDLLEGFQNGGNPYQVFRPHPDSIIVVNKHLVISSGKETYMHNSGDDKGMEKTRYFMHVWTKYKRGWRLAARYVTG